ncbi:MAG: fasciclin domain-containing protein [Bacteroidota bacterium]
MMLKRLISNGLVLASCLLAGGALLAQPVNDLCGSATPLTADGTPFMSTTTDATANGPTACASLGVGVWFSFMGTGDVMIIDVEDGQDLGGSNDVDTEVAVSDPDASCTDLDDFTCSDDPELITIESVAGAEYLVYVGYWNTGTTSPGDFSITLTNLPPPDNDLCGDATELAVGVNETGNISAASSADAEPACSGLGGGTIDAGPGVWYTFEGNGFDMTVSLDNPGTDFDTELQIFSGSCGALTCVGGDDDGGVGVTSLIVVPTVDGETYFVYVDGHAGNTGDYELSLTTIPETVVDIATGNPDFSTLVAALGAADLVGALQGPGPFTVFAPLNSAFDALGEDLINELLEDPETLGCILGYHVVPGRFLSTDLTTGPVTALNGEVLNIVVSGGSVTVNGVPVLIPDNEAQNGVVHVIPEVLIPECFIPAPVYEVNLSAITNVNKTLNEDCQALLTPRQVLNGDWDVDGDGMEPGADLFDIVVQDDNPSNGPIIDGCGTFIYTVEPLLEGRSDEGFEGVLNPLPFNDPASNWSFGTIDLQGVGQQVGVDIDEEEESITIQTLGNSTDANGFLLVADYIYSESGILSMELDFNDADPLFDIGFSLFDFEGNLMNAPLIVYGNGLLYGLPAGPTSVILSEAGVPGSILRIGIIDDGVASGSGAITEFEISNLSFQRPDPPVTVTGFENAWGFVNAEDKTSPELAAELSAPAPLYCDAVDQIDISQLPSNISRCWIQSGADGTTIDASMSPVLRARLLAGGGIPNFTDGCSDVEICVNDIVVNTGACNDVVLTRTFTARDGLDCEAAPEGGNDPAVYAYDIIFTRPTLEDVEGVPEDAIFNCDDQLTLLPSNQFGDENPAPEADDFPFFFGANGQPVYLGANFCNIGATFTDGPRIETCPQTYKFVRTFTVIDWCDQDTILSFPQLVKVGDFEAPDIDAPAQDLDFDGEADEGPLFFSTSNPDCSANFIIPAGDAEDNCDPNPAVIAFILPGGDEDIAALGPFAVGGAALGIPVGDHVLRYIATDACDNSDTLDVDITIGDRTAPVAICEDGLDISIGGANSAILTPDDIDRASYDECSDIFLEIARVSENDVLLTPWMDQLELTCDDIGIVRVALRVTDDGNGDGIFQPGIDNSNVCWLNVLVEDKVGPICIAPGVITTTCDDEDINNLPQDLTAAFAADPAGVGAQLDAVFGAGNGIDNCPDPTVTQTVLDLRNSCGVGTIIRTFTVTDGAGFTSAPGCQQTITVLGVHDYTIVFPADAGSEACIEPDYNAVTYEERACDLLTVTTEIDTFTASADECYKLRITYELLNWCEYNTEEDPYIVPRDADNDDFLEEQTWLHVLPNDESTTLDDVAWLDADGNRFNGFISPLDDDDPNGQVPGSSSEPYGTDESRGAFLYRQFIKVYDDVAPVITTVDPDGPFNDDDGDCAAPVELGFSVADECTGIDAYDAEVELDAFFEDIDDDGVLTLADFVPTGAPALQPIVTPNGDGTFTVEFGVDLPLGTHAIRITATDGCGNADIALIIFEVADNKAPTPICINGLTATLMPDGNGGGMAAIWASEYIASEATDCNGPVEYAIYRASTAAADGFEPMVGDTGLELTCDDLGMLAVRVYAIDAGGQSDYCETTLFVQAFQENVCTGGGDGGSILGTISTPSENAVANVEVSITDEGQMNNMIVTGNDGNFAFTDLTVGDDYTVQPELDADVDVATAVTTFDILQINRHILAIQELATPYQHVAADVTMDGDINVLDVVHVRMVIMGQTPTFPNAPSWRFANADYDFGTDATSWASANFDEVYNVNNLPGDMLGADFYGIQMGDVSGSATTTAQDEDGSRSTVGLETADLDLNPGNTYEVSFTAADLYGFQGTLELAAGLELVGVDYGQVTARNLNLDAAAEGLVAVSFDEVAGTTDEVLFTLQVRATVEAPLSNLLSMTDRVTVAEAYPVAGGVANLGINFGTSFAAAEFSLGQNIPNPVADQTQINYNLVKASEVTFELRDVQGRTILTRQLEGAAGMNMINLNSADFRGATGVLSYTLTAGDYTATRKMIVVR